jgi:hypothetical protein
MQRIENLIKTKRGSKLHGCAVGAELSTETFSREGARAVYSVPDRASRPFREEEHAMQQADEKPGGMLNVKYAATGTQMDK